MRGPASSGLRALAMAAAALLLAAAPAAPAAPGGPRIYEDEWSWDHPESVYPTEEQLFAHTPYDHDWQTHSYYWLGVLDAGWVVVISPFQWTFGPFGSWGLNVIVLDPSGRVFSYDGRLGDGKPRAASSGMDVRAGSTYFVREGQRYHWRIEVPDFSCDLAFSGILPPWIPGDGLAAFTPDGEFYSRYALPAPWAELTGTLSAFGTTVDASGQCLLDSSETVLPLSRANPEIRAFRLFSPPGTPQGERWMLGQLTTVSHPGFGSVRVPMLLLARESGWVLTTKDFTAEPLEWGILDDPPYPFPSRYLVQASRQGTTLFGTVQCDRPYYVTDVFARLPRIFRAVALVFFKRPVIYRMLATFEGTVTTPDGVVTTLQLSGQAEYVIAK